MIVADAFDAMTTSRIYKSRKNIDEVLAEIESLSGSQFDPIHLELEKNKLFSLADLEKRMRDERYQQQ